MNPKDIKIGDTLTAGVRAFKVLFFLPDAENGIFFVAAKVGKDAVVDEREVFHRNGHHVGQYDPKDSFETLMEAYARNYGEYKALNMDYYKPDKFSDTMLLLEQLEKEMSKEDTEEEQKKEYDATWMIRRLILLHDQKERAFKNGLFYGFALCILILAWHIFKEMMNR